MIKATSGWQSMCYR